MSKKEFNVTVGNAVIWTGGNLQQIYALIPHTGIEHFYKISIDKDNRRLVIYGPNMTGRAPLKYVVRVGDTVHYDKSINGGITILRYDRTITEGC